MLHIKFLYIWNIGSREEEFLHVFPYISLCKMKHPPSGAIFGRNLFLCENFTNHIPRMLFVRKKSIWTASSREEIFFKFTKFYPFCPLLGPSMCQPLNFRKLESPFPKDTSYQIWFKSVQWFWRSRLKEKFTDGRRTGHAHYSSLEPSAQVI